MDFYEYFEGLQEGWDGPALLVFSDGRRVGARLDRNGLRPARFWRTKDDMIYVASEVGVLGDVLSGAGEVVAKGRLGPGQMVLVDLASGEFSENGAIARAVSAAQPYAQWVAEGVGRLAACKPLDGALLDAEMEHVRELVGGDTDIENQLRVTHNAYRMYLKVSRLMTDPTDWLMADLWLLASDW